MRVEIPFPPSEVPRLAPRRPETNNGCSEESRKNRTIWFGFRHSALQLCDCNCNNQFSLLLSQLGLFSYFIYSTLFLPKGRQHPQLIVPGIGPRYKHHLPGLLYTAKFVFGPTCSTDNMA